MAVEALKSLQQSLLIILKREDDLITLPVKRRLIRIHDYAVVLQLNLNHFQQNEIFRGVANTTKEIIQHLFSPQNILDCGSTDPTVRLSDQLGQLAKELNSTVEYVVDYIQQRSDSPAVSSSSSSSLKSQVEDLTVAMELIVKSSNRLRRLAEKMKSTAVTSSSPTSKYPEVGSNEDVVQIMDQLINGLSSLQILPIISTGGSGESSLAKYIYNHPLIMDHFDIRAWLAISHDYSIPSILSKLLASVKGNVDPVGGDSLKGGDSHEIYNILHGKRYIIVMDDVSSAEAWNQIWWRFPTNDNGSRIILTTSLMDVVTCATCHSRALMMPFMDDGQSWRTASKDPVVGFYEDMQQMMNQLFHGCRLDIQIIPIVGMGGIGKSTLAKTVYDNPWIKQHFDICAWVEVSQDYSIASILSQLLASIKGKENQVGRDSMNEIEADRLDILETLSGKRYLIVMDDMWSAEAWDHVQTLFPENYNESRIILTTRLMNVATYATSSWSPVHMMRFLDDEQSWRLFQNKVFGDQDCPHELQSVGEKIVKGCGGLPLSIVIVAGLLSRVPGTPKLWQQIDGNDGQLGSILSLSYNHLSPHLRECFLYMAGFPQDYNIHASELIKLWVAEGFLEGQNESKSREEVAKECLEDLFKQSLVLVTSWKIGGKIRSCRLHSMVRDFCARQAGQEKFLLPVMDYFPNPILRRHFLPQVIQNHPRISVSWYDLHLRDSTHSSCTTSIICIPQRGYRPKCNVEHFTSVRVLHVLHRNDHSYWELGQVFELINLTYLASNIPDSIVPPAIAKLQNLQTLIIYRSGVHLPVEIWGLRLLRHLIAFSFHPLPLPSGSTLSLENLQMLYMATNFVCSDRMVALIPNIKKLGICYTEEKLCACYDIRNDLGNLMHLLQLEKLKLEMHSSEMHSSFVPRLKHVFPLSLRKLELSGEWISWRGMTIFGPLPNLQVLKLKKYACYGERWATIEVEISYVETSAY